MTRPEALELPKLFGYLSMVIGTGGHDDRAVDAVLPAGVGRREGRHGAAVSGVAART